jgi:hypothetical protein
MTMGSLAACVVAVCAAPAAAQGDVPAWLPTALGHERYVVADWLFMQRDNGTSAGSLVLDGDTQQTVIGGDDLRATVAPGIRLFVGERRQHDRGWEIGYLGVYGMFADATATGAGNLEIEPPLSGAVESFAGNSTARATYGSTLNSAEANVLYSDRWMARVRDSAYSLERWPGVVSVDWLAGFRWAGLDETAAVSLAAPDDLDPSVYAVRASSHLFGAQVGLRGRVDHGRWALEGQGKAALAGSVMQQGQDPIIDTITGDVYRDWTGGRTGGVGGIFDIAVTLVHRFNDTWSLRMGYTSLWLAGVALAPDQFDFSTDDDAGTAVRRGSSIWLGGGTLGLEAAW